MAKSRLKKGPVLILIVIVVLICFAINFFGEKKENQSTDMDEGQHNHVDAFMNLDIETDYPKEASKVVEYYVSTTYDLYRNDISIEEFTEIAKRMLKLCDNEFVLNNDVNQYVNDFRNEILLTRQDKFVLESFLVSNEENTIYSENEGEELAKVESTYVFDLEGELTIIEKIFILRKDKNGNYKILGFKEVG